jgi:hypothetical protein
MIIPVIIGATGTVRGLKKNLEDIPGKLSIDTMEKTVALGISHIMSEVLKSETLKHSTISPLHSILQNL